MLDLPVSGTITANAITFFIGAGEYRPRTDRQAIRAIARVCSDDVNRHIVSPINQVQIIVHASELLGSNFAKRSGRWRCWALRGRRRTRQNLAVASVVAGMWASVLLEVAAQSSATSLASAKAQ